MYELSKKKNARKRIRENATTGGKKLKEVLTRKRMRAKRLGKPLLFTWDV
jgi:hypothetical protein